MSISSYFHTRTAADTQLVAVFILAVVFILEPEPLLISGDYQYQQRFSSYQAKGACSVLMGNELHAPILGVGTVELKRTSGKNHLIEECPAHAHNKQEPNQ
jgi:hypothetical protein